MVPTMMSDAERLLDKLIALTGDACADADPVRLALGFAEACACVTWTDVPAEIRAIETERLAFAFIEILRERGWIN